MGEKEEDSIIRDIGYAQKIWDFFLMIGALKYVGLGFFPFSNFFRGFIVGSRVFNVKDIIVEEQ